MSKAINTPKHITFKSESAFENILQCGGFALSRFDSEEQLQASIEMLEDDGEDHEVVKQIMEIPLGTPFITTHARFKERMSEEHILAILLHEEGHFALGHHTQYTELGHVLQHELEADAYAASIVGKSVVKNALKSLFKVAAIFLSVPAEKAEELVNRSIRENENLKPRFDALS